MRKIRKNGREIDKTKEQKRKEFARLLARGAEKKEAYLSVFGEGEGRSDQSIRTAASRLARLPDVQKQVQALMTRADAAADEKALMSRERRMKWLSDRIQGCDVTEDKEVRTAILCIQELNKMDGSYEPEKMQVEQTMSIATIVKTLQAQGCRPPVH